jgi:hypothetical protein
VPDDRFLHSRAGHSVKVSGLGDFEYRVWTQYLLSADDFGVMRLSAVALQAENDALAERPAKAIEKALASLVSTGLLRQFEHQGRTYLFQHDWQHWQKVSYPRKTKQPKPCDDSLGICDEATVKLFALHPGGDGRKFVKSQRDSGKVPGIVSEELLTTRARVPAKRLTANGERLVADGGRQRAEAVPALDLWFEELLRDYPQNRISNGYLTQSAFSDQFDRDPRPPREVWEHMKSNLANHLRSHEWRVKGMAPKLDRWLREGLWRQVHEEVPMAVRVNDKTARTMASAAAFAAGEDA